MRTPKAPRAPDKSPNVLTPDEHLDAWRRSGTSARVYAEQHGLKPSSLYSWRRRRRHARCDPPRILPVLLTPSATCEILLPDGRALRFHEGIAADALRAILRAMERT